MAEEKLDNVPNRALLIRAREILCTTSVDETQLAHYHEESAQCAGETEETQGPFDSTRTGPQVSVDRVNVPRLVHRLKIIKLRKLEY